MRLLHPPGVGLSGMRVTQQMVILARLRDFCSYGTAVGQYETEPWHYMTSKLREIEPAVRILKQEQLAAAKARFCAALEQSVPDEAFLAEFREVLDRSLAPGDFIDIAFNLNPADLAEPSRREMLLDLLNRAKAQSLFDEQKKPFAQRSQAFQKIVKELNERLTLDVLDQVMSQKAVTPRRKSMVLRRLRRNVANYCAVLHVPATPEDTFSPFMLHRVEAMAVACLGFLDRHR